MRIAFIKHPNQAWLLGGAVLFYLATFYVASVLGFLYAVPVFLLLPAIAYYLTQSIVKPILLLVPMLGATYLGNIVSIIPEGTVPLTLFQIFLIVGIVVYFFHYLISKKENIRFLGIELELLLIITFISFTIIYSPNRGSALLHLTRLLFLIILVYLIVNILKERSQFYVIYGLFISIAIILSLLSIRATILNPALAVLNLQSGGTRIFGRGGITIEDPNVFATLFYLPIACTTSILLSNLDFRWRIPASVVTLILLAGLASTYSRSAWIATAFLLVMLVVYYRQYKLMIIAFSAVIIIILSVPEFRTIAFSIFERLAGIFAGASDDSSRLRIMLGNAAINMFFDSYMMGVGFRGFPMYFSNYYNSQEAIGLNEPHNIIYELLTELGIIGFSLFVVLTIIILRKASFHIRISRTETDKIIATTLISTLAAYLIFYQFYGGALNNSNLWAIVGMIIAQGYYLNTASQLKESEIHLE